MERVSGLSFLSERRLKERQLKKSMRHTWEIFREQAEKEKRDTDLV